MLRIVASLGAMLLLAAVPAVAQDKMKESPKSGHESMAKAAGPHPTPPSSRRRRVPRRRTSAATPRSWARAPTAR